MQQIFFDNIKVNSELITEARGRFTAGNIFKLNHKFEFIGEVDLFANNENLTFDGFFKIKHNCATEKEWVKFRSEIDPNAVKINLDEKILMKMEMKWFGVFNERRYIRFYTCF